MANTRQHLLAISDDASPSLPNTIKLDRDNYCLWKTTIISTLETFDLESFVLSPTPPLDAIPDPDTGNANPDPAFAPWKKKDRFILMWIRSTLLERLLALVARSTTSYLCLEDA